MEIFVYDGDGNRVAQTINGVTTYFVGAHYELTGSQVTKYYFAGTTRIAMRKNGTVSYLLGDHLGSTSITTDAAGTLVSELRYKPWGETRYSFGTTPTQYQYTSQYSYESDFGLYFYNARFYDPALGRFTSPDAIIPQHQGVQAWDRFAYTNNNPVRYTDPSGRCILCVVAITGAILATPFVLSGLGVRPDVEGALIASAVTGGNDILVTAGIAVQSQYPWALVGDTQGWAQAKSDELGEKNPFSPSVATEVMEERIYGAIDTCKLCNDGKDDGVDKLIVAALAQNGFDFSVQDIGTLPINEEGGIAWEQFLSENGSNPSAWYAQMRQSATQQNYDTRFMLKLYIQDLKLLMSMGYDLPDWLSEKDIKYVEDNYLSNKDNRR
jgi:RHS repeat-associated protein